MSCGRAAPARYLYSKLLDGLFQQATEEAAMPWKRRNWGRQAAQRLWRDLLLVTDHNGNRIHITIAGIVWV